MTTQRPWGNKNKQAHWRSMDQFSLFPPSFSSVMILHAWFSTIEWHRLVKLTWNIHQISLPLRWQWMAPSCHSLDLANHSHILATETLMLTINLKQDSLAFNKNLITCMNINMFICVHTKMNNLQISDVRYHKQLLHFTHSFLSSLSFSIHLCFLLYIWLYL